MSHFSVLVAGNEVEKQLEPYWELDYATYEEESRDHRAVFKVEIPKEKVDTYIQKLFIHLEKNDSDLYLLKKYEGKEPEEIIQSYEGFTKNENGDYGRYFNPNAKWDWWVEGGRWSRWFKLKPDFGYLYPDFEIGSDNRVQVDSALKKHIDFETEKQKIIITATNEYNRLKELLGDIPKIIEWKYFIEKFEDMEERREKYYEQDGYKQYFEITKNTNTSSTDFQLLYSVDLETFQSDTIETYCKRILSKRTTTFAVVLNGKWYERGEMGWWACVSNEKSVDEWYDEYHRLLDSIPDDTLLTIIDCHI